MGRAARPRPQRARLSDRPCWFPPPPSALREELPESPPQLELVRSPGPRFPEVGTEGEGKELLSLGAARPGLFDLLNDLSRWLRRSALLCLQPALGEGEAEGPSPAL